MDLPTYTNIWRIEKRLYKLYDFRLPMPLPINWIAVFAGITIPYVILLIAIGLPFNHTLVWLYVLPPGLITWLTTRPVIENKRLPELLESQVRYLTEPRTWVRFAPLTEKEQMVVTARVWRSTRPAAEQAAQAAEDEQLVPVAAAAAEAHDVSAAQVPGRVTRPSPARKRNTAPGRQVRARASATGAEATLPASSAPSVDQGRPVVPPVSAKRSRRAMRTAPGSAGRSRPDVASSQPVPAPLPAVRWPSAESWHAGGTPAQARGGAADGAQLEMSHDGEGWPAVVPEPPAQPARPAPPASPVNAWPAPVRPLRRVPQETREPQDTLPSEPVQPTAPTLPSEATAETSAAVASPAADDAPADEAPAAPAYEHEPVVGAAQRAEGAAAPATDPDLGVQPGHDEAGLEGLAAQQVPLAPAAEAEPAPAPTPSPELEFATDAEPDPEPDPAITRESLSRAPASGPPKHARPPALERAHEPVQRSPQPAQPVAVTTSVEDATRRAVPSIERALSGPSRDRTLSWHGTVKIITGAGPGATQGPGARDQEALDRNRARLPIEGPRRILILGCTAGAGQTVTALMAGSMLASLRGQAVAAVDLHDGTLARYRAPAAWLDEILAGRPPQAVRPARPDGLHPTPKASPARLDVIASHEALGEGDEIKLAVQLNRHYPLTVLDGGPTVLAKLLKVTDQLVLVAPANVEAAGALADTRDWLDAHGHADLAMQSVTVINGVSRRSLPDVELAESIARGRSRAIVRVPWDDMLPVATTGPSALRPQTRVAYTALAGVLSAGLAAAPVRRGQ